MDNSNEIVSSIGRQKEDENYSLCVCLYDSDPPHQNPSFWIKINPFMKGIACSPLRPISKEKSGVKCPYIFYQSGSAVVGSMLYLFGGLYLEKSKCTSCVSFINTTAMDESKLHSERMFLPRSWPSVLTIDKKIYIFGSWTTDLPLENWGEVLNTESESFSDIRNPPASCHYLLQKHSISACAIINNGEEIIFAFAPSVLLLLYNVKANTWFKFYIYDIHLPLTSLGRDRRFSSRSPVINNVLYSYDPEKGCVYAFDLHTYQWFQKPVKLLIQKNNRFPPWFSSWFPSWEETSLNHFMTHKYSSLALVGIHHFGKGLLCMVLYEDLCNLEGTKHLHCLLVKPVVGNSTDGTPFIHAEIQRTSCFEVSSGEYLDSVAVCLEKKVPWMGKQELIGGLGLAGAAILLGCGFGFHMFRKRK